MASVIKVDRIQSDTGTVNLASNLAMTGQAVIPSINLTGGQIVFPATQNPSAGANTLDDYEEGTWTPAFTPIDSGSITMSLQQGVYAKIGRTVFFSCRISTASISTPTGGINVTGLPFASGGQTRFACTIADMRFWGVAFTTPVTATIEEGNAYITLTKQATNAVFFGLQGTDMSTSSGHNQMQIAGFYTV